MNDYRAVIFDLGKVVFDLSFDRVFQFWALASGRPYAKIKSRFQFDNIFEQFEKDEITSKKFRTKVSQRLGLTLTDKTFDEGWCNLYLDTYHGVDEVLASLKHKYQLIALTNTNSIHSAVWNIKYTHTLRHFQKIFSSHQIRERKPDAKAYQIVLDYLQVKPQQAVFIDDSIDNTEAAEKLGIKAILVTSTKQMTAELQALGLLG